MNATVRLPNSAKSTTPLGVGMATLMREPSPVVQQRLLAAAHDAGFRYFDVAPSYGLGAAESALGRFLRSRPDGVTVATKVGIRARETAGLMRTLQRPARALLRRFPGLRGSATRAIGSAVHTTPDFSPSARSRSLERSLKALGIESLDLLLLHEAGPSDLADHSLIEWLDAQKRRGVVRNIGVATSAKAATVAATSLAGFDVVQFPSSVLHPAVSMVQTSRATVVTHTVLSGPLAAATARGRSDPGWLRDLSACAEADMSAPGELARLVLAWALDENPGGIVLLGTSSEPHLRSAARAVGAFGTSQLGRAGEFLRATLQP